MNRRPRYGKFTDAYLTPFRDVTDPPADDVVRALDGRMGRNMLERVELFAENEGGVFRDFLDACHDVPKWADFAKMEPGRRLAFKYSPHVGGVLLAGSLIEGYTLGNAARVLVSTGRLNNDVWKRLSDTSRFVYHVALPRGIEPGHDGHRAIMRVRLAHAVVRYHLRKHRVWDAAAHGAPINQEDMAFTLIEFSYLLRRGIGRLGISLTDQEQDAHHLLWRYIGHVLGVHPDLLTKTRIQEKAQYHAITRRQRNVTEDSIRLAHDTIAGVSGMPPMFAPKPALYQVSRRLIGNELADALEFPRCYYCLPAVGSLSIASSLVSRAQRRVPLMGSALYHAGGVFAGHTVINSLRAAAVST